MAKTRNIAFKIINPRSGGQYAELACDVAVGYTDENGKFVGLFENRGFFLKKSKKGEYYYQAPSKPRLKNIEYGAPTAEGVPITATIPLDDNGYKIYDNAFDLYLEKGAGDDPNKRAPTSNAWDARKYLLGLMVEALNTREESESANTGRGSAPRAPARAAPAPAKAKAKPAAVKEEIEEEEVGTPTEEEDDDFPW